MLIYADNRLVDPWLVAQGVIEATERLCPLVAVQPAYMHPYAVAKMVATLGYLHGRKIYLNMVAGGFKRDLEALGDMTPHDARYTRLVEYSRIIMDLARDSAGSRAVSFQGSYYTVRGPEADAGGAGRHPAGAVRLGLVRGGPRGRGRARRGRRPLPAAGQAVRQGAFDPAQARGIRVGIIARADGRRGLAAGGAALPARPARPGHPPAGDEDLGLPLAQGPVGAAGGRARQPLLAAPVPQLPDLLPLSGRQPRAGREEIARYIAAGFRTFILDVPPNEAELHEIQAVFAHGRSGLAALSWLMVRSLQDYVTRQAERRPQATALVDGDLRRDLRGAGAPRQPAGATAARARRGAAIGSACCCPNRRRRSPACWRP